MPPDDERRPRKFCRLSCVGLVAAATAARATSAAIARARGARSGGGTRAGAGPPNAPPHISHRVVAAGELRKVHAGHVFRVAGALRASFRRRSVPSLSTYDMLQW